MSGIVLPRVERLGEAALPTDHGLFRCVAYAEDGEGQDHLVLVRGDPAGPDPVLVRVHSECLTGDVFGSRRCDCGPQLDQAMTLVDAAGRGVIVYLRGHEGRGIGIGHKVRAYALQDEGLDTVDANLHLGLPVDARRYLTAAAILQDLGVMSVWLLTNNPAKTGDLEAAGLTVAERVPLVIRPTPENAAYLRAKAERLGHHL